MDSGIHHHGLQYYLDKIAHQTPMVKALIKQASGVTEGIQPDSGYAKTMLDVLKRSSHCNKALTEELKSQTKSSQVKTATISVESMLFVGIHRRQLSKFL